jgi:2-oxo-4-hydroxy-4-carboxy--5-ureidoimidazoline (OHCU) decarboxylase
MTTSIEEALEGSTPLAIKLRAGGPYRSSGDLVAAMRTLVSSLSEAEKIATLNAHPRIGEDPTRLSPRSLEEQGCEALPELDGLNAEYERRFGFRFVVFVNGRSKSEIAQVLRHRLRRSREQEMGEGLRAIIDIAQDRLKG